MQGGLFLVLALLTVVLAQKPTDKGQGCCFFRGPNFQDEIRCTSDPFNISDVKGKKIDGVKSFFCTEGFSAAILNNNRIEELIDCGDVVNETTSAIPAEVITVGACLTRRCCFYTGRNKDGDEYCLNDLSATADELARVQSNSVFVVGECVREWRASIVADTDKKIEISCGETLDFPAGVSKIKSIKLVPCPQNGQAMYEFEVVENTVEEFTEQAVSDSLENSLNVDQAVADTFGDSLNADQAVVDTFDASFNADQAVADTFGDSLNADQAVVDTFDASFNADQAVADQAVADQAVADQAVAAQAVADQAVADQAVADQAVADQAVADQAVADQAVADQAVTDQAVADQAVVDSFGETLNSDQVVSDVSGMASDNLDQAATDNFDSTFAGDQFVDSFEADKAVSDSVDASFASDPAFNIGDSLEESGAADLAVSDSLDSSFASENTFVGEEEFAGAVGDEMNEDVVEEALLDAALSETTEEFDPPMGAVNANQFSSSSSLIVSLSLVVAALVALF